MTNPTNYAERLAAYEAAKQVLQEATRALQEPRTDVPGRVYWHFTLTRRGREEMAQLLVEALPGEDPDRVADRIAHWIDEEPDHVDALDWQEDELSDPGHALIVEILKETTGDISFVAQVDARITPSI